VKFHSAFERRRPFIQIIPLLDVMFFLLLFFMYAILSMTAQRSVGIDLPRGRGAVVERSLTVIVDRENRIVLDGRQIPRASAAAEILQARAALGKDVPVVIRGDRAADLGTAIELLSALRDAGLESVAFETEPLP
jgi:biopolymer transport protein ExbD